MDELDFENSDEMVSVDADRRAYAGPEDTPEYEDYDCVEAPIKVDESKYFPAESSAPRSLKDLLRNHAKRAAEYGGGGEITVRDWALWEATLGHCCAYCGDKVGFGIVEHVVPLAWGGENTVYNVVPACEPCNLAKGAKAPDEWLDRNGLAAFLTRVLAADAVMAARKERPATK